MRRKPRMPSVPRAPEEARARLKSSLEELAQAFRTAYGPLNCD
jgi:hypothetical protein